MRKEEFFEVLGELDDDIVKEAGSNRKEHTVGRPVWVKWGALAACLCLAAAGAFAAVHLWGAGGTPAPDPNGTLEREPEPSEYPPAGIVPGYTLDEPGSGDKFPAVFNDVDAAPVGESAMIALMGEDFCPMSAEESLAYFGVTLPEDGIVPGLELTGGGCAGDGHGVYRRGDRGVYFDANWYEFTGSGKSVTLTLRTRFHLIPSTEQVVNGPEHIEFTEFRGWELTLFRYADENGVQRVYTEFVLDGVTCTVSASGLGNSELALALRSLLPQKEHVPGPVTVTGAVTHVDSRTGDYFDGTQHHYSEDHDFIDVDCGGTFLTVWLPGEADRFRVGDIVTVTYNGEPATAYNIWPGQLVSVE